VILPPNTTLTSVMLQSNAFVTRQVTVVVFAVDVMMESFDAVKAVEDGHRNKIARTVGKLD
jgi:hypothetical protein